MERIRLYSGPLSMFGAKAQVAALEKGVDVDLVMVPFDMERLYDPKHPEVVRINPKRQVPVLVHGALELFDSTQVFEYLEDLVPEPPLWGRGVAARALARRLELESDEVYFPHVIRLMSLQDRHDDPAAIAAREGAATAAARFEALLADREFLAGDFSFADIAFWWAQLFGERMGAKLDDRSPRLRAWRERIAARPAIRTVAAPMARFLRAHGRPLPAFLADAAALPR
ncbi:MAG TPA: glutathione S-transferase family protein [Xanthomonadales bacterium]|nr:glutathione S-transferase family protein [Xanthomonadales bacterium]